MRQTSVDAYNKIKSGGLLSKRRMQIYDILFNKGPLTYNEIFTELDGQIEINSANVGARVFELVELGCVQDAGNRKCTKTGMTVTTWDVTTNLPQKLTQREKIEKKISVLENKLLKLREKLLEI